MSRRRRDGRGAGGALLKPDLCSLVDVFVFLSSGITSGSLKTEPCLI